MFNIYQKIHKNNHNNLVEVEKTVISHRSCSLLVNVLPVETKWERWLVQHHLLSVRIIQQESCRVSQVALRGVGDHRGPEKLVYFLFWSKKIIISNY